MEFRREGVWPKDVSAAAEDYAYCRQIMQAASRNYSFAGSFLPRSKRQHVEALYALLRVGDDLVDVDHGEFESPEAAIDYWQRTYDRAFQVGTSPDPVMRAYLDTARTFEIPQEIMESYFRAMRQDLTVSRYQSFDGLLDYVAGSALPVGRAMTYILGVRPPYTLQEALPAADALSIAMQLSNFLRDIPEDWERGRVYLPQDELALFGVTEGDLAAGRATPAFKRMMSFQIERTESYYAHARQGVGMLSEGQWAVQSGLLIYRAIIVNLKRTGYDPFLRRASASTFGKMGLVAKSWLQTR